MSGDFKLTLIIAGGIVLGYLGINTVNVLSTYLIVMGLRAMAGVGI